MGINHVTTGNPATVDDAVKKCPLGTTTFYKGEKYMYVQFNNGTGNVAMVPKAPVHWMTLDPDAAVPDFVVSSDQTDALYGKNGVAGISPDVIVVDLHFCWIKISGEHQSTAAIGPTGAVAGDKAIGSASDNVFAKVAADTQSTNVVYGVVKAGSTASGPKILLQNLDIWGDRP